MGKGVDKHQSRRGEKRGEKRRPGEFGREGVHQGRGGRETERGREEESRGGGSGVEGKRVCTMGRRLVHFALPLLLLLATAALDPASAKQHRAAKGALHHKKAAQHKKAVHHKKVAHHRKVRGYQGKGMRRQSQAPCFVGVNYGLGLSTHPIPVPKAISIIQGMGASGVKLWAPDRSAYAALAGNGGRPTSLQRTYTCWVVPCQLFPVAESHPGLGCSYCRWAFLL